MSAQQWYMAIGAISSAPFSEQEVISSIENGTADGNTLGVHRRHDQLDPHRRGAVAWRPTSRAELSPAPPPMPGKARQARMKLTSGSTARTCSLSRSARPGESAVAEAGSMMNMTDGIQMETVFGDGSQQSKSDGIMGALMGAGKRLLTGESLFMTVFTNGGPGKHTRRFAAPYRAHPCTSIWAGLGGTLICQKDSFLCAARGVSVGIAFQRKIGAGLFGGEENTNRLKRST